MKKILTFTSITLFTLFAFSTAVSAPIEHTHGDRTHTHELPKDKGISHKHGNGIEGKKIAEKKDEEDDSLEEEKDHIEYDHHSCSSYIYQFYSRGNELGFNSKGKSNYTINITRTSSCQGYAIGGTPPDMFGPSDGLSLRQRQNRNYQICLIGFDHGLESQRMSCETFIKKTS